MRLWFDRAVPSTARSIQLKLGSSYQIWATEFSTIAKAKRREADRLERGIWSYALFLDVHLEGHECCGRFRTLELVAVCCSRNSLVCYFAL